MKKIAIVLLALVICSTAWANFPQRLLSVIGGNTDYTQDANVVGAWFMNENNTTEQDETSNNNDLTQNSGNVAEDADVPSGYSGTSRLFIDDNADYLEGADGDELDINGAEAAATFCGWVKYNSIANNEFEWLFGKMKFSNDKQYNVYARGTGTNQFQFRAMVSNDGSTEAIASNGTYSTGTWYHVCGRHDPTANEIQLVVDGSEVAQTAHTTGIYNSTAVFTIGHTDGGGNNDAADAYIDEVIVFDSVKTDAEITDIMNNGIDGSKGAND